MLELNGRSGALGYHTSNAQKLILDNKDSCVTTQREKCDLRL